MGESCLLPGASLADAGPNSNVPCIECPAKANASFPFLSLCILKLQDPLDPQAFVPVDKGSHRPDAEIGN